MTVDRRTAVAVPGLLALLLSGCAAMPDDGGVKHVNSSHRANRDSQVRVFGVSPQQGEAPKQIVRGFLEATTSDEAKFSTAEEYLTDSAAAEWDPFARTTVLSSGPSLGRARAVPDARDGAGVGTSGTGGTGGRGTGGRDEAGDHDAHDGYTVEISGTRMAEVDSAHAYAPDEGDYSETLHLTKADGEWRIDRLPDGLVVGESDFQRIYRPINTYYYARLGPDADAVAGGKDVLVADPVYLRRRIDPVTETVSALLAGPTRWLDPVVASSFPQGARLASGQHLSLDDSGTLAVQLNARGARADGTQCARMAAQVLHTVQDQASAKVNKVELNGPDGDRICDRTREQAGDYKPGRLNGSPAKQYFVDGEHRVSAFTGNRTKSSPVPGALGRGEVEMGAVAVNRSERDGAAVSRGGRALYVASLAAGGADLGDPVLTSKAKHEQDRLTAPTWDGLGDVWIADRDPDRPRLLRLRGGKETPEEVEVPDLGKGERIESVRIASDGVRIALRIQDRDGHRTLQLGRVQRSGTATEPEAEVTELRPVAPQMEDVAAASWAGGSRLVVVGRESGGVQQLQYMETDGSVANQPTLPGINDVTGVTASEDETKPLLADSEDGIVRLPPDANWKTLTDDGSAPAYPG